MRSIKHFLAALTLVGVAAMVVLAPGAAGSGVAAGSLTSNSVVWDSTSS